MQFEICNYDAASSHPCFITFWTRPWVLKLRGMKGLEEGPHIW